MAYFLHFDVKCFYFSFLLNLLFFRKDVDRAKLAQNILPGLAFSQSKHHRYSVRIPKHYCPIGLVASIVDLLEPQALLRQQTHRSTHGC
jgi:hypothetical protein